MILNVPSMVRGWTLRLMLDLEVARKLPVIFISNIALLVLHTLDGSEIQQKKAPGMYPKTSK